MILINTYFTQEGHKMKNWNNICGKYRVIQKSPRIGINHNFLFSKIPRYFCQQNKYRSFSWLDQEAVIRLQRNSTGDTPSAHPSHMIVLLNWLRNFWRQEVLLTEMWTSMNIYWQRHINHGIGSDWKSPHQKSTCWLFAECGVSQASIVLIMKEHRCCPYKMQMLQHLNKDNPDRWLEFCECTTYKLDVHANFSPGILFTNEANFYVNGEVNHQNLHYRRDANPHWVP